MTAPSPVARLWTSRDLGVFAVGLATAALLFDCMRGYNTMDAIYTWTLSSGLPGGILLAFVAIALLVYAPVPGLGVCAGMSIVLGIQALRRSGGRSRTGLATVAVGTMALLDLAMWGLGIVADFLRIMAD